jgi:hypothetical protein
MSGSTVGIVIIVVVVVLSLAVWLTAIGRAARRPHFKHPQQDQQHGLVHGGTHVGGGRSVMPTRDAPVPQGGGTPPPIEEQDAAVRADRDDRAAHAGRPRGHSPMDL